MIEHDESLNPMPDQALEDSGSSCHTPDFSTQARQAYEQEDFILALHLYLAAFEYTSIHEGSQSPNAIMALRFAWEIACVMRERSLAEYIYEKIEPFLSDDELESYTLRLQDLALDKLSELGISRNDLEEITGMISDELGEMSQLGKVTPIVKSVHVAPESSLSPAQLMQRLSNGEDASDVLPEGASVVGLGIESKPNNTPTAVVSSHEEDTKDEVADEKLTPDTLRSFVGKSSKAKSMPSISSSTSGLPDRITYADIVGFDDVIEEVRSLGLGIERDPELLELSNELRQCHGIEKITSYGSIVFRTTSRDDASFFMGATVGELGLPAMRVQVQPGPQGMPVLAVSVSTDKASRINPNRPQLDVPSVLVLEDIDVWGPTLLTNASVLEAEGPHAQSLQQANRGVREALTVIHAAVANPEVCVLASMGAEVQDENFLYELLEPMSIVDMYLPTDIDRLLVWKRIAAEHPSIAELDLDVLARLSRNMCRMDIVAAAREALEDVYRTSLKQRKLMPLTQEAMYSHLANYQSLDSAEYKELEDLVAQSFGRCLEDELHDLLSDGNNYGD